MPEVPRLVTCGFVGVPRKGERKCDRCKGVGKTGADILANRFDHLSMIGCDRCEGTGVVRAVLEGE